MKGVSKIFITEDVALVTFPQIAADIALIADIFTAFSEAKINIDMISQTAPVGRRIDLSFTLPCNQLVQTLELINRFRNSHAELCPMVSNGNCKVQLYGEEMREMHGVAATAISAVAQTDADISLISTSEVDISMLITQVHCMEAVESLERTFGLHAEEL